MKKRREHLALLHEQLHSIELLNFQSDNEDKQNVFKHQNVARLRIFCQQSLVIYSNYFQPFKLYLGFESNNFVLDHFVIGFSLLRISMFN